MPSVLYKGESYEVEAGESVLDCLTRNGHEIPYSCKSGVCQSCLMKAESGTLPAKSQAGLNAPKKAEHYFMACVCMPETDLVVAGAAAALRVPGVVEGVERLGSRVYRLDLRPEAPFDYRPGQFVNLLLPDGTLRSYSLASVLDNGGALSFHIAHIPGGAFSGWVKDGAVPGDTVEIQGPMGACFYTDEDPGQPLLLAATGTGLAPLYGIARDALRQGHRGPIHLFHGSLDAEGLYLVDELRELAEANPSLSYTPCVLNGPAPAGVIEGNLETLVLDRHADLAGFRVFLCGHPDFVKAMQRRVFLAGASLNAIFADAFLPSQAPANGT